MWTPQISFITAAVASLLTLGCYAQPTGATNSTVQEGILAGPLPYDQLERVVLSLLKSGNSSIPSATDNAGVYLCDGLEFTGNCYYGRYPVDDAIFPDGYWVTRLKSFGVDPGYTCDAYACDCRSSDPCPKEMIQQDIVYPGGDLRAGVIEELNCFECWSLSGTGNLGSNGPTTKGQ